MIHTGDCIEVMRDMPADSVDAVVTDPPYGLEFMGKEWDSLGTGRKGNPFDPSKPHFNTDPWEKMGASRPSSYVPTKMPKCRTCGKWQYNASKSSQCSCEAPDWVTDTWTYPRKMQKWHYAWAVEALRVTKPGGYLLAFGGTRTHHRLVCGLEDAGWIIRDELDWIYACLSDDTEILTSEGWRPYNGVSTNDTVLAFDSTAGKLQWEPVQAVHRYTHEGDMVRLVGDGTDQLVTLNHRLVLVDGQGVDGVSGVRDGVLASLRVPSQVQGTVLLEALQRDQTYPRSSVPAGAVMERRAQGEVLQADDGSAQSSMEGRRYHLPEARELLGRALRPRPRVGEADGPQGWLHHGAPATDGGPVRLPDDQGRSGEPREPRPDRQSPRELDALALEPGPQAVRVVEAGDAWSLVPTGPVTATRVDYAGMVWCVTVPSGAFVARRRGLAFVTGNSGFPKGRANLKPAHEPIVLARKPGPLRPLNIEETRISMDLEKEPDTGSTYYERRGLPYPDRGPAGQIFPQPARQGERMASGRWPSNVLLGSPELFDSPNPYVVGSGGTSESGWRDSDAGKTIGGWGMFAHEAGAGEHYGDSGGYSRFFIIPKADRADREPVLRPEGHEAGKRFSTHPTMKPVDLMRHLIRLVTPPGGTVLDPFLGSGSTAIAAELEGFPWIGIEKEPEYVAIAEARLNGTQRGLGLDTPLVGEPRKPSLNKPTEWKSDGDGIGERVAYHNGVGAREAGSVRGGYDQHLMESPSPKPVADTAPMFDEEPAA